MNYTRFFVAVASLIFGNSHLFCYTVYVRNYAKYAINAQVRLRTVPDVTAYNIVPGEERHINIGGGCVNGIVFSRYNPQNSSDTSQGLKQWDWGRPYNVFESIGDRKPCGSNVFGFMDDMSICHIGVDGKCDGRAFSVRDVSVNQ